MKRKKAMKQMAKWPDGDTGTRTSQSHVCATHDHNVETCNDCKGIYIDTWAKLCKTEPIPEKEIVSRVPLWAYSILITAMIISYICGFKKAVDQPPIEKPYEVVITKYKTDPLTIKAYMKTIGELQECQSDYKAQRETIRILKRQCQ